MNDSQLVGRFLHYEDDRAADASQAAQISSSYLVGDTVTVYYNPAKTSQSCLRPGTTGNQWGMVGAGLAMMAVGTCITIWNFSERREYRRIVG